MSLLLHLRVTAAKGRCQQGNLRASQKNSIFPYTARRKVAPRRSLSSRHTGPYEPQQVPADDSRQRAFTGHLNIYHDAVIAGIRDAESILMFGPGEAKGELKKRRKKIDLGGRIVSVETVDKMTNRQIPAKVRRHLAK
jgi:hypothetical protein